MVKILSGSEPFVNDPPIGGGKTVRIPAGSKLSINGEIVGTPIEAFHSGGFVIDSSELTKGLEIPAVVSAPQRYAQIVGRAFRNGANSVNLDPAYRAVLETHIAYWSTETIFHSSFLIGLWFFPGDDGVTGWGYTKHDAFIDLCGRLGAV